MKILGEKSLASKVELGLEILFFIIALIDIAMVGVFVLVYMVESARYYLLEKYFLQFISSLIVFATFLSTGLIALYIIHKFIGIFENLKQNKEFDKSNIDHFHKIYISSIAMGILYFAIIIGLDFYATTVSYAMGEILLVKLLLFVFSVGFFIFGIGIKILNEIYKEAVKHKEENELTI